MDKIRILLVEDEAVTAMDLKSNLIQLDYEVAAIVATGEEAVRQTFELHPDLILMDITLAGPMTGVQTAEVIQQSHNIPIIYLTAHTDSETLARAKLTEPFGYLPKPCNLNTLVSTIEMALYKSEADKGRRKAEAELNRLLTEQKIVLDNLGKGVLFLKNRKVFWSNPAMTKLFGYSSAEMAGNDTEIFHLDRESYLERGKEAYAALTRGEAYSVQAQMKRKDGSLIWCSMTGQAVNPDDLEQGAIWILDDITERRRMEEALRNSEEKFRTVANFTHDWELWIAPDERILYCSPSCERITGHPSTAFENDPSLLRRIIHPDDLGVYEKHRKECNCVKESFSEFEFRINRADGATRWIAHVCRPVFDSMGQFIGTRGSNRDITEGKSLQAEVAKARNLEALGILAGGIAHDFNNLFQGLLGNISLAKMCLEKSNEAFKFLENAEQVYASAAKLTGQLVAFSTGGMSIRTNIQPSMFVREMISADLRGSGLMIDFDLPDDLGLINVDPVQFRQVLTHTVKNAVDAMPADGKLKIRAANETLAEGAARAKSLAPGNYLRISIQDNGSGISKENLPRIFDPYFSTKERGAQKGMGLGLSLCSTIVQKHGGAITVESEIGKGSTFDIFLPAIASISDKPMSPPEKGGHDPRILIMDDDQTIVLVATRFLQSSGFRVSSTPDGKAAIEAYQKAIAANDPFALVILDLTIPNGMGGKETFDILKEIDPQVKAIVSSGYINDTAMTDFAAYGFVAAFEKPYRLDVMKERLDRLIQP